MIPDFKTYIKESAWGSMLDRGAGDAVRKEDDINLLDLEEFYWEYLEKHYRIKMGKEMCFNSSAQAIDVPILIKNTSTTFLIIYNFRKKCIIFNTKWPEKYPKLFHKMCDEFEITLEKNPNLFSFDAYFLTDKDNKVSNKTFVDVLNFIIDNEDENNLMIKRKRI